jgi:hypothetical protein
VEEAPSRDAEAVGVGDSVLGRWVTELVMVGEVVEEWEATEGVGVEEGEGEGVVEWETRREKEEEGEKEYPRAELVRVGPGEEE